MRHECQVTPRSYNTLKHSVRTDFYYYWSFNRKTLLDDGTEAQKLIQVKCTHFNLNAKNQLISTQICWELVTQCYKGRPVKCTYFVRPLRDMVILWLINTLIIFLLLFAIVENIQLFNAVSNLRILSYPV